MCVRVCVCVFEIVRYIYIGQSTVDSWKQQILICCIINHNQGLLPGAINE